MTAKRKAGGTLARLEALEAKRAARVQAVEEEKARQVAQALDALDVGTLRDLQAHNTRQEGGGSAWARFVEVADLLTPLFPESSNPARAEALRWADLTEDLPDGQPFPTPEDLPDFVAYFDEEARACDAALSDLAGLNLPEGVLLEEARQVIEGARASWKLWASMGRVLLEVGKH